MKGNDPLSKKLSLGTFCNSNFFKFAVKPVAVVIMRESKKFAFDVGITFVASVGATALGFGITILLGRYLGAESLGLYRMSSTLLWVAKLGAAFGIPAAIVKFTAEVKEEREKLNQVISSGVITSVISGALFVVLFYSLSGVFARIFDMPGLSPLLKLLSFVFPFTLVAGILLGMLNGLRKMKKHSVARVFQSVLLILVTVILFYYGFGVAGAIGAIVISSIGDCALLIWFSRNYWNSTLKNYISTTKKLIKFGSQIFGASIINQINLQADTILIGYFLTAAAVGQYAVAVGLSRFFWLIPNAVQTITYPATSEYWAKENHAALKKMIDKSMKYSTCILFPIGVGVGVFAEDIIAFVFGEGFIDAVLPLRILIFGTVIQGSAIRAIGSSLAGVGRPDISLRLVTISASANIVLNVLLIPYLGIVGAALTTTCSLLLNNGLGLFFITRILKVKIDIKWNAKMVGITAIVLILLYIQLNSFIMRILILLGYVGVILMILLTKEDRKYFMELIGDIFSYLRSI